MLPVILASSFASGRKPLVSVSMVSDRRTSISFCGGPPCAGVWFGYLQRAHPRQASNQCSTMRTALTTRPCVAGLENWAAQHWFFGTLFEHGGHCPWALISDLATSYRHDYKNAEVVIVS